MPFPRNQVRELLEESFSGSRRVASAQFGQQATTDSSGGSAFDTKGHTLEHHDLVRHTNAINSTKTVITDLIS